jgi:hypothetical protein
MAEDPNFVRITSPWNDREHVFTGVPPHCALLQQLQSINNLQNNLLDNFVDNVVAGLNRAGVAGERITTENLNRILNEFKIDLRQSLQLTNIRNEGEGTEEEKDNTEVGGYQLENDRFVYRVHVHSGGFSRLPVDWRFPRCGIRDLWRQWWMGDTVRSIPPLRKIKASDVFFLNKLPLEATETHGRKGGFAGRRRPARKTLYDISFLMNHVTTLVMQQNAMAQEISERSVSRMFAAVESSFTEKERDLQKNWATVYKLLRERLRAGRL